MTEVLEVAKLGAKNFRLNLTLISSNKNLLIVLFDSILDDLLLRYLFNVQKKKKEKKN